MKLRCLVTVGWEWVNSLTEITCCFFSSLKTLAIDAENVSPHAVADVPGAGIPVWPVLGDR